MMKKLLILLLPLAIAACGGENREIVQVEELPADNPAAPGFNAPDSDPEAIAWADAVMKAQGGRQAWDETRYLRWNFFGRRTLLWDKQTGLVRIEVPADSTIYLINVEQDTGRVLMNGQEVTDPQLLKQYIDRGEQIWVNDSYWLVMPYKLKDTGVSITYEGQDTLFGGGKAALLELRFAGVGYTPENKYRIYVDPADSLVKAWAYYEKASMDTPNFVTPWGDYQRYGEILLSGDRGQRQLSDIQVLAAVDEGIFQEF